MAVYGSANSILGAKTQRNNASPPQNERLKPQQLLLLLALLASQAFAAILRYQVKETSEGDSFLDGFDHEDLEDPTHCRANYVVECTALEKNLTYVSKDTFGPTRDTVRISSKKRYGYGIMILTFVTCPMVAEPDPRSGPIQTTTPGALEGKSTSSKASMTRDPTPPSCTPPTTHAPNPTPTWMTVTSLFPKSARPPCATVRVAVSVTTPIKPIERRWDDENVPDEVKDAASLNLKERQKVNPDAWGQPQAKFVSNNTCDLDAAIKPQNIVINLTLSGNAYLSTCPSNCVKHVNKDPTAFKDAYWDIASLTILSLTSSGASKRNHHSHKRN
ncbi:hypothetical protein M407DRAFT_32621 [Tulasnella calospora MUT 4182]|uniref:Glycoside hydrolase family 16 protein n=1 Tax=Tulasnella calospora MUT 4182 TaxID=1051891 RepID=A0A0C3K8E2_9AGAM|nr:hypothetical protein M407DRAFT_32621 [Tulasnella calospora MUT 4182]